MPGVIAVVGAGRMGSFFASQVPLDSTILVLSRSSASARLLADAVGGRACESVEQLREADLVVLAVPASAVAEVAEALVDVLRDGAVVLNMATGARMPDPLQRRRPSVHWIEAKVIGHAGTLRLGVPGMVVVDCTSSDHLSLIREHLRGYGEVVRGDDRLVATVNRIASREAIRAALAVRRLLAEEGFPDDWIRVAIANPCSGTVRAFAEDDLGHFAQRLVEEIEEERGRDEHLGRRG